MSEAWTVLTQSGAAASCVDNVSDQGDGPFISAALVAAADANAAPAAVAVALLRWQRPQNPEGLVVSDAWLRLWPTTVIADDLSSLQADWYSWEQCDANDLDATAAAQALSVTGHCDSACGLANLSPGGYSDLALDNAPDAFAPAIDYVDLRLSVNVDVLTGVNGLVTPQSVPYLPGPGLVVRFCPPTPTPTESPTPTPTATPPPGCDYHVLTTTEGWVTLSGGIAEPLPFLECDQPSDDVSTIVVVARVNENVDDVEYFIDAKALLRWDTSTLPQNMSVQRAWLGLCIGGVWTDNSRQLVADWYDWGESCDADDATTAWGDSALSADGACSSQCNLSAIAPQQCTHFELDDAAAHITGDTVSLRLGIAGELATGLDGFTASLGLESDEPALVVLMCQPTPTPTP